MLYGCYALAEQDEDFSENLHQIEERYQEIIDGLSLTLSLEDEFAVIEKNFRAHDRKGLCGIPRRVFKRYRNGGLFGI